ncbi:hypothetical protein PsorP6_008395 [Peronosclerospora sorghi]|uniref:Uncharacterized protein n=1 Tax=Peronosclerospora sorghi TaxID=230839 RepID=A0ACC0W701_9STRA|nr:hypothetical protein PsorP6_008395 [Peronosclerospora sorghi]
MSIKIPISNTELMEDQKLYRINALQVVGEWSVHDDGHGRIFYYSFKSDSSQWKVPEDLMSLETEFMMKLMLENAVARSGDWTAHDAGNGTLYYFNSKTRVSAWERPSEWGGTVTVAATEAHKEDYIAEVVQIEEGEKEEVKDLIKTKEKKKAKKHKKQKEKGAEQENALKDEAKAEEDNENKEPLTVADLKADEEHNSRKQKWTEQFRAMLRDKNIMPLCKWSVALPQIAGDPRFVGVPTMDERRAIFNDFVKNRREDLKAEKKSKLKHAKQIFTDFLHEQFKLDSWEPSTTLRIFLSTLEDNLQRERYERIQHDALALLTLSTQEKIYAKAVADYKSEALKRDGEQLRLTKFLENKLATEDKSTLQWESSYVRSLFVEFYRSVVTSGELLSEPKQRQVFDEVVAQAPRDQALNHQVNEQQSHHTHKKHTSQSFDVPRDMARNLSPRHERHASDAVAATARSLGIVRMNVVVEKASGDAHFLRRARDRGRLGDILDIVVATLPRLLAPVHERTDYQDPFETQVMLQQSL